MGNYKTYYQFKTPAFVVDKGRLLKNCSLLNSIRQRSGAKILLALKGFAMHAAFDDMRDYLDGICASSPHEAQLGRVNFNKEVHSFASAYSASDFATIQKYSDHIIFNSISQYKTLYSQDSDSAIRYGLRINPEHSEGSVEIYDPCATFSRLGITSSEFPDELPEGITGLHMHTLCEQNSDAFRRTFFAAESKFERYFKQVKWINCGGGHHITRSDYDIEMLIDTLLYIKNKYQVEVFLEPGEAVALNCGFLVTTILDIVKNGMQTAIVDTSATAHMPDVIEMPYRPDIIGSKKPGETQHTYRIAGLSCLAGDIIGDYSFDKKLQVGDKLILTDMAHYTMVKTSTFNGLTLPDIIYYSEKNDQVLHKKSFDYTTFKDRLS